MQQQAYFVYEKKEQGICILRCYVKESRVVVPEEIEGLPVTEIAPYAFAADMEKEPKNPGELPCICGELLGRAGVTRNGRAYRKICIL